MEPKTDLVSFAETDRERKAEGDGVVRTERDINGDTEWKEEIEKLCRVDGVGKLLP